MRNFSAAILCLVFSIGALANPKRETHPEVPFKGGDDLIHRFQSIDESLAQLNERMSTKKVDVHTRQWAWQDLESFQAKLWRALALDPAHVDNAEIPKDHHPRVLTELLRAELAKLSAARSVAQRFHADAEFDEYVAYCNHILHWRDQGLFQAARVEVKKGELEGRYLAVAGKISGSAAVNVDLSISWSDGDRQDVMNSLGEVKQSLSEIRHAEHGPVMRIPASVDADGNRLAQIRKLFWVLVPLVFATGFVGGLVFRKSS